MYEMGLTMATSIYRKQFPGSCCCRGHSAIWGVLFCGGIGHGVVMQVRADGTWRELNGKERKEARDIVDNSRNVVSDRLATPYAD